MKLRTIAVILVVILTSAAPRTEPANAETRTAITIGRLFNDGLDPRLSAQRVAGAAGAAGYSATSHLGGRRAIDAWVDGQKASVVGLFGHSSAGIFMTDEGPVDADDEFIAAGTLSQTGVTVGPGGVTDGAVPGAMRLGKAHWAFWKEYLPYVDVDDVLLAILAGCYTANPHPAYGSFLDVGREKGMDSVVGWTDLIFFPTGGCVDCNYSGNYFWSQWATYAQQGDTAAVALSKANSDLLVKEGSSSGWDRWYFGGALPSPGDVRIAPAARGTPLNSSPFGIGPFQPLSLPIASSRDVVVDGRNYLEVSTDLGVVYRVDKDTNDIVWLFAPASTAGTEAIGAETVLSTAVEFARESLNSISMDELSLVDTDRTAHQDGEIRHRFVWRSLVGAVPGSTRVEIEIDGRTGSVVGFSASQARPVASDFAIGAAHAEAVAEELLEPGYSVQSSADIWDRPRWIVRAERPGGLVPDVKVIVVDATNGKVVAVQGT